MLSYIIMFEIYPDPQSGSGSGSGPDLTENCTICFLG